MGPWVRAVLQFDFLPFFAECLVSSEHGADGHVPLLLSSMEPHRSASDHTTAYVVCLSVTYGYVHVMCSSVMKESDRHTLKLTLLIIFYFFWSSMK